MDGSSFDRLVRHFRFTAAPSRRELLRSTFAATVAGLGAGLLLGGEDAGATQSCRKRCKRKSSKEARKDCRQKCKKVCRPKTPETPCQKSSQCCPEQTKYICAISHNSGNDKVCCGTQGATCSTTFQCCLGFNCEGEQCVPMGM